MLHFLNGKEVGLDQAKQPDVVHVHKKCIEWCVNLLPFGILPRLISYWLIYIFFFFIYVSFYSIPSLPEHNPAVKVKLFGA